MPGDPEGLTDLHSHLVPGVDDGSRSLEESLESMGKFRDVGVRRIVTTPHLDGSLTQDPEGFEATMDKMDRRWASLLEGAGEEFPGTELHRGFEIMLDVPDPDLTDGRLSLGGTRFVLVEWAWSGIPPGTLRVLARLKEGGLTPVLAHPERYRGLEDLRLVGAWRRAGAFLQVNYGSLVGRYGGLPQKRALELLERGWADLLSSDFHGRSGLSPDLEEAREVLAALGGDEQFEILAGVNTLRILRDQDPDPVPPLAVQQGLWEKVRSFFR
jgi:protein-tyrosine phosphatase